jgi:class 3 adenylate cyclase
MLIGRQAERERLDQLVDAARQSRSASLLLLGEAGVGKTALLEYAVDQTVDFRQLHCMGVQAESELPFSGLSELLRPVLGLLETLPARQARALRSALDYSPSASADRYAVFAATLSVLAAAAESRAILCLVDDAQWIDSASLDALLFAARRLDGDPIAFLFAVRDDPARAPGIPGVPVLRVEGLSDAEGHELLKRDFGRSLAPAVASALVSASGGNPLALLELPRALTEEQRAGRMPLPSPLPTAGQSELLFSERIKGLSTDAQQALIIAAASDVPDVRIISKAIGRSIAALGEAETAGLIRIVGDDLQFRHPLVRSAVYHGATSAERREAHCALASVTTLAEDADRRAWHLAAATSEPDDAVADELERAANRAAQRGGLSAEARILKRAADLTEDAERRAGRLLRAATASVQAGRTEEAARFAAEGRSLTGEAALRTKLGFQAWLAASQRGEGSVEFDQVVREVENLAEEEPQTAATMLCLAWCFPYEAAHMEDAKRLAEASWNLCGGSADTAVIATGTLAWQRLAEGEAGEAHRLAKLATQSAAEGWWAEAMACGDVLAILEDYRAARDVLTAGMASARNRGASPNLAFGQGGLAMLELRLGRLRHGYVAALEAVRIPRDTGHTAWSWSWAGPTLAALEALLIGEEQARLRIDEVRSAAEHVGDKLIAWQTLRAESLLHLGAGRPERAIESLAPLAELVRVVEEPRLIPFEPDLIEALAWSGDHQAAEQVLERFRKRVERVGGAWGAAAAARGALMVCDSVELPERCEEATALALAQPSPFERARTDLIRGERLRRAGKRTEGRASLEAARLTFSDLGAERWADRALRGIKGSARSARRRAPGTIETLTSQELQVAMTVAEGATNREAASRLYLSPKTIEMHLSRIYRKLGISSRSQLARLIGAAPDRSDSATEGGRLLAAVLFTDIVSSTDRANDLGDQRWLELLEAHNAIVRSAIRRHDGVEIKSLGDGFLARFPSPTAAISCAFDASGQVNRLGIKVRAGIHAGECIISNGDLAGIAVHVGARVADLAGPDEVLVSSTVRELSIGNEYAFAMWGRTALKGIDGEWTLWRVEPSPKHSGPLGTDPPYR